MSSRIVRPTRADLAKYSTPHLAAEQLRRQHRARPLTLARDIGLDLAPWQQRVAVSKSRRILICTSRQAGKSTIAAMLALHQAICFPGSLIIIVSRAQRQSSELFRKVRDVWEFLLAYAKERGLPYQSPGLMVDVDNVTSMEFANGSRIVSLPANASAIRSYSSVDLLLEDEAAFVPDQVYRTIRPMLIVSRGRLVLLSTPFGKRGHFWHEWSQGDTADLPWERYRIPWQQVKHLPAQDVQSERRSMGSWWFSQEYECNPPEAPIWMGDFSFKPLGDVKVGDAVIGWAPRRTDGSPFAKQCLTRSVVLGTRSRESDLVEVTLESGRKLRCTPDHKWLSGAQGNHYAHAQVGRSLMRVIDPTSELASHLQWDAAWLGGVYDGEGSSNQIAQSPAHNPEVYERIGVVLQKLGLRGYPNPAGWYFTGFTPAAKKQALVDFLNWTKPTRSRSIGRMIMGAHFRKPDRVVSIRPIGRGTVTSMQTSTGNYVAWGYASKNCTFHDEIGALFSFDDINAAIRPEVAPFFATTPEQKQESLLAVPAFFKTQRTDEPEDED
jgi:hypothetical protein